jgi:hypothetical protein
MAVCRRWRRRAFHALQRCAGVESARLLSPTFVELKHYLADRVSARVSSICDAAGIGL